MSQVSQLQAEVNRLQARNNELRYELSELGSGVSSADREMNNYLHRTQQTLAESNNRISSSHERIIQAHEIQLEIDKMYVRFKNMELANKKIRECNNKKYYDFGCYATVRKIVQGMLDNLNLNMISDDIIYKSIEKEHLQTPDYWLTSALISIMAWKNDDKSLADRAMDIAVKLDKKNAAIFYMLFNIRMGRDDAALKWFMYYQNCELKGSDQRTFLLLFSMLSKTIQNDVDSKIKYEIITFINKVIAANAKASGFSEEDIVNQAAGYLHRMKDTDTLQLTMMKRCLQDYAEAADVVVNAAANINILQFILDVGNVSELEKNAFLDRFINEEIARPNKVEKAVYDEIEYNELVIKCNGDMAVTEGIYQKEQERRAKDLNLISEMINWIYKGQEEVNPQMRKSMFTLTADIQRRAAAQFAEQYRRRRTDVHPVVLGDYATTVNFDDRSGESSKITAYYENQKNEQLAQVKNTMIIVGIVLAVAGVGIAIATQMWAALVLTAAGGALAGLTVLGNNKQRKLITETCEMNIKNKNDLMDQLFGEYETYKKTYEEYDAYQDKIMEAIDHI